MKSKIREHARNVAAVFALTCLGASYFYGWFPLIVMVIGLAFYAYLLEFFDKPDGNKPPSCRK